MASDPHVYTNDTMVNLANWLINQHGAKAFDEKALLKNYLKNQKLKPDVAATKAAAQAALGNTGNGVTLGQLGQLGMGAVRANPLKSLALAGSVAGNIGGLTDDDKFGGQLGGAALAGLAGRAMGFNPLISASVGGNIGTLFDKLRAQKEAEQAQMKQYAQGYK